MPRNRRIITCANQSAPCAAKDTRQRTKSVLSGTKFRTYLRREGRRGNRRNAAEETPTTTRGAQALKAMEGSSRTAGIVPSPFLVSRREMTERTSARAATSLGVRPVRATDVPGVPHRLAPATLAENPNPGLPADAEEDDGPPDRRRDRDDNKAPPPREEDWKEKAAARGNRRCKTTDRTRTRPEKC